MVEGPKSVEELVNSELVIERIYSTENFDFLSESVIDVVQLISERELDRISGLKTPNKILAVAHLPSAGQIKIDAPLIIALDGINDPGNLGTIVRTAKWFGVNTILCSDKSVDAFDRKVVQSSMGSLFHTNIHHCRLSEELTSLKQNGFQVLGADALGTPLNETGSEIKKMVLVIGSESHGLSPEVRSLCDEFIAIPNRESDRKVESLNAAVATSILLYQLTESACR